MEAFQIFYQDLKILIGQINFQFDKYQLKEFPNDANNHCHILFN